MVYAAQNYYSKEPPQNNVADVDLSRYEFNIIAKSFQVGMMGGSNNNSAPEVKNASFSAVNTGTYEGFGRADFDAGVYGKGKDAEKAGYTIDADIEPALEKTAPSQEIANLQAYQQLRNDGFSHDEIYQAQTRFGVTNQDMLKNVNEGKGLVPEEDQDMLAAQTQTQKMMQQFELREKMADSEQAQNGVSATMAGAGQSFGVARMAVYA